MIRVHTTVEALQTIIDSAPVALMMFRSVRDDSSNEIIDFEWVAANQKTAELIGISSEQLIGGRLLSINPHNKPPGLFDKYVQVVETGTSYRTEIAYDTDDVDDWYDITATKQGDCLLLSVLDVTTRKRAELELSRRTEQLQTTLNASLNSILSMTAIRSSQATEAFPKGKIVDFRMDTANQAVIQSLGYTPEELVGVRLLDMFPENVESGLFDVYTRVTDTGQSERTVQYYTDDKGLDGWFEVQAVKQGVDGVVVTFMNITEAKRHEKHLQRSNDSLQDFAYVASHDLQEPLRKVQSFSNLLAIQYSDQLGAKGLDLLVRMQSATERMQQFIRDLLTFSRLNAQPLSFQQIDLNNLLTDVLSDLETTIESKQAVLHITPLPTINGDALQLRQLFQNLLSNSLKFMDPNRKPHIQIVPVAVGNRNFPRNGTGSFHAIQILDNGIGFDEQYSDRIFTAFQRLHNRSQYEGTGIGLAIVKRVVELHKGLITATSEPGKGSAFTVYLPS